MFIQHLLRYVYAALLEFYLLNMLVSGDISMIHIDLISVWLACDVTVITGIQSWECFVSALSQVKSDFPSENSPRAAEDLNIIGPLASRIPTAKSGISPGRVVENLHHHHQSREGAGGSCADPSFKWGLKTGHFYRFIRTFRTSWLP